ncbi:MAG: hypothetical protein JWR38_2965 [Mucilaginibacter sp.]|nr:hypothetical protein [Mucilaginibacter sp.]
MKILNKTRKKYIYINKIKAHKLNLYFYRQLLMYILSAFRQE